MQIDDQRLNFTRDNEGPSALRLVPVHVFGRRLRALKSADPSRLSEQQVFDKFAKAFHGYRIKSVLAESNGVYRVRPLGSDGLFRDAACLWYPEPKHVKKRGRFNAAGQPRFYASSDLYAALLEMRPNPGDRFVVLVAGKRSSTAVLELAHVGLHRAIVSKTILGNVVGGLRSNEDFVKRLHSEGIERRWIRLDNYLTDLCVSQPEAAREQDFYKLTLAASTLLLKPERLQGIVYPTVAGSLKAFNLCLKPDQADLHFFPAEAWLVQVTSKMPDGKSIFSIDGSMPLRFLQKSAAISSCGKIDWFPEASDLNPADFGDALRRSSEIDPVTRWQPPRSG